MDHAKVTAAEKTTLRVLFKFLRSLYARPEMQNSKLMTDQPHFYTMVTTLHALGTLDDSIKGKIAKVALMIDDRNPAPKGYGGKLKEYMELSSKQTTHPGRRASRQQLFTDLLDSV